MTFTTNKGRRVTLLEGTTCPVCGEPIVDGQLIIDPPTLHGNSGGGRRVFAHAVCHVSRIPAR